MTAAICFLLAPLAFILAWGFWPEPMRVRYLGRDRERNELRIECNGTVYRVFDDSGYILARNEKTGLEAWSREAAKAAELAVELMPSIEASEWRRARRLGLPAEAEE